MMMNNNECSVCEELLLLAFLSNSRSTFGPRRASSYLITTLLDCYSINYYYSDMILV